MIQEIHSYISSCPLFEGREVNVDFLAQEAGSISITPKEGERIIKKYCTGETLREYLFSLSMRSFRNKSLADSLRNEQLCENFADWLDRQSENGNLPSLPDTLTAQKAEVVSGGWLADEHTNHAVYQIDLRLIYTKM